MPGTNVRVHTIGDEARVSHQGGETALLATELSDPLTQGCLDLAESPTPTTRPTPASRSLALARYLAG